jgi:hypothetical protein
VAEARHVTRGLHVRAKVEDVDEYLHVALPLLISAVLPRDEQRPASRVTSTADSVLYGRLLPAMTFGLFESSVNKPPRLCRMNP